MSPAYKAALRENAAAERKSHAATTSGPGTATKAERVKNADCTGMRGCTPPLYAYACDGPGGRGGASAWPEAGKCSVRAKHLTAQLAREIGMMVGDEEALYKVQITERLFGRIGPQLNRASVCLCVVSSGNFNRLTAPALPPSLALLLLSGCGAQGQGPRLVPRPRLPPRPEAAAGRQRGARKLLVKRGAALGRGGRRPRPEQCVGCVPGRRRRRSAPRVRNLVMIESSRVRANRESRLFMGGRPCSSGRTQGPQSFESSRQLPQP